LKEKEHIIYLRSDKSTKVVYELFEDNKACEADSFILIPIKRDDGVIAILEISNLSDNGSADA